MIVRLKNILEGQVEKTASDFTIRSEGHGNYVRVFTYPDEPVGPLLKVTDKGNLSSDEIGALAAYYYNLGFKKGRENVRGMGNGVNT